ncbi:MAG: tRNA (adenosine(37)-N6)-threonylcarbamoyltransferase complex ATPase subunit type 1 TsaE [SAR324 cluster bacterium]|uniref:tRNA threonylcarbamoyladenosine biosynthesis protein TsaE n=1 Tax=SAR324 cluster bacterium TaxID=2024889 RepID=A0A2A4TAZ2_9DELT|nr:MAG: tRNA (adenosine(37)-N6)-threonylcarbamoyltransferase complex ATPase subunit type 1 TsaE [SAR324 cluster bacterium]
MTDKEIIAYYSGKSPESLQGKVIGLVGDLGAGKTHLVGEILSKISKDFVTQISSPSFNLCNIYETNALTVHHFDLYRIESEDELYNIEIWESLEREDVLTFIEWVNSFPEVQQACTEVINITMNEDEQRQYMITEP